MIKVPIGTPVDNTSAYLLDRDMLPVGKEKVALIINIFILNLTTTTNCATLRRLQWWKSQFGSLFDTADQGIAVPQSMNILRGDFDNQSKSWLLSRFIVWKLPDFIKRQSCKGRVGGWYIDPRLDREWNRVWPLMREISVVWQGVRQKTKYFCFCPTS